MAEIDYSGIIPNLSKDKDRKDKIDYSGILTEPKKEEPKADDKEEKKEE